MEEMVMVTLAACSHEVGLMEEVVEFFISLTEWEEGGNAF